MKQMLFNTIKICFKVNLTNKKAGLQTRLSC